MLTFILIAVTVILVAIGLVKLVDKFIPSKFKPFLTIALWLLIGFLSYQTYLSIYEPIQFNKLKKKRYKTVITSLIDIRDAQLAHRQVTGKFSDNFESLIKFVDTAKYTITQRKDSTIVDEALTKLYGVDTTKEIVVIDTLGFVPVKDSLFKNSNRYKNMMNVPVGEKGAKFKLRAGYIRQNDIQMAVFEASVLKDVILYDQNHDLLMQENQVISVDEINGNMLRVGSMNEVKTTGYWPKTYGSAE